MSADAIRLEQRTVQAGRTKAEKRMRLWNFYQAVDKEKTRADTVPALESVVESSGKMYGMYMAVMETLLPSNPLGALEEVAEKKVLGLYALHVGCQEALHELEEDEPATHEGTSIPLNKFSFGIGKAKDFHLPLDNLIKYHAGLLKRDDIPESVPKEQLQRDFLIALKQSIEHEVKKPGYASLTAKMKRLSLSVNGRIYRGFASHKTPYMEAVAPAKIVLPTNPDEIIIVGNKTALQELDSIARILPLYDPESQTNVELTGQKPLAVLLYGQPGTGKTLMIKKFIAQVNQYAQAKGIPVNPVNFDNSHKDMYHGMDVKNLQKKFARLQDPASLGIGIGEDIDGVLQARSARDASHIEGQSIHEFLNQLDGLQTDYKGNYLLVFTTNHVEKLDDALFKRITNSIEVKGPTEPEHYAKIFMIEMGDRLTYVQMQRDEIATFGKQCMAYGFTGRDIDKIAEVTRRHVTNVTGITSDMHQMSPAAQQEALHGMRRRVGYDFVKAVTDNRYKANLRAQKNERDGAMQRELGLIEARYEAGMQFLRKRLGNGHVDQAELKIAQDSYTQSFVAQMSGIHG